MRCGWDSLSSIILMLHTGGDTRLREVTLGSDSPGQSQTQCCMAAGVPALLSCCSVLFPGTYHLGHFFDLRGCHVLGQVFKNPFLWLSSLVFQGSSFIHLAMIQEPYFLQPLGCLGHCLLSGLRVLQVCCE